MNKFYSLLASAAVLMGLGACSTDNTFAPAAEGDAVVNLTVQLPGELNSRAFSDGKTATQLTYAVYEAGVTPLKPLVNETQTLFDGNSLTTTVSLQLVTGKSYNVVFWAQDPLATCYDWDADAQTITVDYSAAINGEEGRDAFFGQIANMAVNGSMSANVELYRPFAQINVGTNDISTVLTQYGATSISGKMKVTNAYTTLNLLDGSVEDGAPAQEVTFSKTVAPTEAFPVAGYDYLTMGYVLVGKEQVNADLDLDFYLDDATTPVRTLPVPAAPLKRNYRTNVYGSLLTSDVLVNVEIKPLYDGADKVYIWNGKETIEPEKVDGKYVVENAGHWAWLMSQNTISTSVEITKDINFFGYDIKPVCTTGKGVVINGNGHSMANATMKPIKFYGVYITGLLGLQGFTVKDLTIKNMNAVYQPGANEADINSWVGILAGCLQDGGCDSEITNVTIENCSAKAIHGVGAAIGFTNSPVEINGLTVKNTTISNDWMAGESGFCSGIIGKLCSTLTGTGNTLANVTVNAVYDAKTSRGATSCGKLFGYYGPAATGYPGYDASGFTADWDDATCTFSASTVVEPNTSDPAAAITNVIASNPGIENIRLAAGNYELPASIANAGATLTIEGAGQGETFIALPEAKYYPDKNVEFKNLTINAAYGTAYAESKMPVIFRAVDLNYDNCLINGPMKLAHTGTATFNNCSFVTTAKSGFDGYNIHYYGYSGSKVVVNDCDFHSVCKGIVMYSEGVTTYDLTVNNSTFEASTADDKCAIQMHTEYGANGVVRINNCTATGFLNKNNCLWQCVNNQTGVDTFTFDVFVDGVQVLTKQ